MSLARGGGAALGEGMSYFFWHAADRRSRFREQYLAALILVDRAVFHDEDHALRDVNIVQRIAGHGDDIREFPWFERACAIRHAQQVRVHGGPCSDRAGRLHPKPHKFPKFPSVPSTFVSP